MSSRIEQALEILGVAADSDPQTLARAYRRLARVTHPDVSVEPDAAQRFAAVASAYRTAADYARSESRARSDGGPRQMPGPAPFRPTPLLRGVSPLFSARHWDRTMIVAGPVLVQASRQHPVPGNPGTGDM